MTPVTAGALLPQQARPPSLAWSRLLHVGAPAAPGADA